MAPKEPYKQSDGRTLVRYLCTSLRSGASHLGCEAALNASKGNSSTSELILHAFINLQIFMTPFLMKYRNLLIRVVRKSFAPNSSMAGRLNFNQRHILDFQSNQL